MVTHARDQRDPRLRDVPDDIRQMVMECQRRRGTQGAARAIGVSRPVVLAVMAGTGVTSGSLALIREYARHRRAMGSGEPPAPVMHAGLAGGRLTR